MHRRNDAHAPCLVVADRGQDLVACIHHEGAVAHNWLVDRLANTLDQTYGYAPCVDAIGNYGRLAALTIANNKSDLRCTTTWKASSTFPPPAK